ncbi:MAG: tRNA uridine-5-carboxymethylaminomethyl(34) synthesis GTPase MnmE [Desulfomonile tiedjei]|nr:tRNA uridine-5-carboxymethylaminomethyl(34) synthesis GTPase MnmE [Desulfomonile tiedjei]
MTTRPSISSDTIVALSTPRGYSGIGVIRISGPDALGILRKIFHPRGKSGEFSDRAAVYGRVVHPHDGRTLDDGIALVMRSPASYTGEDMVELSLHGSPVVLDAVERLITNLGARPATRGEFTRRAFLSGRLDLIQAEAVIDLIEARSMAAAEEARATLESSVSKEMAQISDALKDGLATLEAHIDFDDDDQEPAPDLEGIIRGVADQMQGLLENSEAGKIRRQGINTVIVGKPNVGKSTLFNALLRSDRVIVTPYPGTTRDLVDDFLLLDETAYLLCDTAGIRHDPEPVEEEGIRRTHERIKTADLVLAVLDGAQPMDDADAMVLDACREKNTILILNKQDLGLALDENKIPGPDHWPRVAISARTGQNLSTLEKAIADQGHRLTSRATAGLSGSLTDRGLLLVHAALMPMKDLIEAFDRAGTVKPEIVSLEIRKALDFLEEITGERVDEGILDRIFERFCVGK